MDRIEDDWVAVVPAAFLKIIEKISRLATVAEASKGCTDSGKGQIFEQWSSKHSPNIKSFISATCFLGEVPSLRGSHLDSFCTYWNHTQHVKDVLLSGAGLQFPWFLRFRGGISPMPRDQAIGGIVDFLRLAGDWFRINLGLRINL
jgi:hypothetical protein